MFVKKKDQVGENKPKQIPIFWRFNQEHRQLPDACYV